MWDSIARHDPNQGVATIVKLIELFAPAKSNGW
jgi:hypothetical protein